MAKELPKKLDDVQQVDQLEEIEGLVDESNQEEAKTQANDDAMVAGVEAVGKVSLRVRKFTRPFRWYWAKKKFTLPITLVLLIGLGAAAWASPFRYDIINIYSDAELRVMVIDNDTAEPVSGAAVIADGGESITDGEGMATLFGLPFGDNRVVISRTAYETSSTSLTIKESFVDLGTINLNATGITVDLQINDSLSSLPIDGATVIFKDVAAQSDETGLTHLVIPPTSEKEITVMISQRGYNSYEGVITVDDQSSVLLIPEGRNHYFSNRSGKLDLYSSNLDGSDEKIELAGTGSEGKNIALSISLEGKWAAIVSTRDGTRDDEGVLQPELFVLNLEDGSLVKADEGATSFSLQGWAGGKIIYSLWISAEDSNSNQRYKLKTYDPNVAAIKTIQSSNSLSVIALIGNDILYTHRETDSAGSILLSSTPEGLLTKVITGDDVYFGSATQTSPTKLVFEFWQYSADGTEQGWYEYDATTDEAVKLAGEPANLTLRRTIASQNNVSVAWVERRDGKDRLFVADANGENERIVTSRGNISYPIKWIGDDIVIFRVRSDDETADYVINVNSDAKAQKITDVFTQSYNYGPYY